MTNIDFDNKEQMIDYLTGDDVNPITKQYVDFKLVSERLRDDFDIVMIAINIDGYNLQHAGPNMKANREIVMAAVKSRGNVVQYINSKLLDDEDIIRLAIEDNFRAYTFASKRVQKIKGIKERYEHQKLWSE